MAAPTSGFMRNGDRKGMVKLKKPRLGLVIRASGKVTNELHPFGSVIMWEGPETEAIRELTPRELEDYHDKQVSDREKELDLSEPEPGTGEAFVQSARETSVLRALEGLDHNNESHWTDSGKPAIKVVEAILFENDPGAERPSRPELNKFAPHFRRLDQSEQADGERLSKHDAAVAAGESTEADDGPTSGDSEGGGE